MTRAQIIIAAVGGALILGTTGWVLYATLESDILKSSDDSVVLRSSDDLGTTLGKIDTGSVTSAATQSQLLYLIEEEKLAHDVYTKMYELYGANVFGNILKSEATHQSEVLVLLTARSIADPRSSELGVFKNADLQALYDKLILQGTQGVTEAYKVGVAIEELDIKDISNQLETAADTDVITTLEKLRRGSENHLRAFNRQLG